MSTTFFPEYEIEVTDGNTSFPIRRDLIERFSPEHKRLNRFFYYGTTDEEDEEFNPSKK